MHRGDDAIHPKVCDPVRSETGNQFARITPPPPLWAQRVLDLGNFLPTGVHQSDEPNQLVGLSASYDAHAVASSSNIRFRDLDPSHTARPIQRFAIVDKPNDEWIAVHQMHVLDITGADLLDPGPMGFTDQ